MAVKKDKLIDINTIKESMILIEGSDTDYVTSNGVVYKKYSETSFYKKSSYINKKNGYVYIGITMKDGKNKNHRLHRIVAKAFVPNPNNHSTVKFKNGIRHDVNAENLYWTTARENIHEVYNDSKTIPVIVFKNKEILCEIESVRECSRRFNIPISTILSRCNDKAKSEYRKYQEFDFEYKEHVL